MCIHACNGTHMHACKGPYVARTETVCIVRSTQHVSLSSGVDAYACTHTSDP